jgi:hypothetical protein
VAAFHIEARTGNQYELRLGNQREAASGYRSGNRAEPE